MQTIMGLVLLLSIICLFNTLRADGFRFYPASYYSDHMVLQRAPARPQIWGYAERDANITVVFRSKYYHAMAKRAPDDFTSLGIWRIYLDPTPPGGPYTIMLSSKFMNVRDNIQLKDVMFGDVWVCSGQSNMAFPVPDIFNASQVIMDSYKHTNIRLLALKQVDSSKPLYDVDSYYVKWSLPNRTSLGIPWKPFKYFSAVCYLYGVNLHKSQGIPIGLISTNWGGTPIQAWSSSDVLASCPNSSYSPPQTALLPPNPTVIPVIPLDVLYIPQNNSALWNSMIRPLLNMTILGVIWYQGEANTIEPPDKYACLFPAMISDWRKKWFEGSNQQTHPQFPFGFVQLCTSNPPFNDTTYAPTRWAQTANYGYTPNQAMPNVFMATSVDLPDPTSPYHAIHPRSKQDVADRLSLGAQNIAYNQPYISYEGPFPKLITCKGETEILVQYMYSNIEVRSNDTFRVCCSKSKECKETDETSPATIKQILSSTSITLTHTCSSSDLRPVSLRYLWEDMPCEFKKCAIYGKTNQLPGPPFDLPVTGC